MYAGWYNFLRIHKALKVMPAMVAGITDTLMDTSGIVGMIDAQAAKVPAARGRTR